MEKLTNIFKKLTEKKQPEEIQHCGPMITDKFNYIYGKDINAKTKKSAEWKEVKDSLDLSFGGLSQIIVEYIVTYQCLYPNGRYHFVLFDEQKGMLTLICDISSKDKKMVRCQNFQNGRALFPEDYNISFEDAIKEIEKYKTDNYFENQKD